jgi:NTE family protein
MRSQTHETPKVGLALSCGAAHGMAHIGVLKALAEECIPIDVIAGTSAGAIVGACYAKERSVAILEEITLGMDWRTLARFIDPSLTLLRKGFLQGEKVKSLLRSIVGDVRFEQLEIPFAVVAADARNMQEIVINTGSVVEAVRASISMPVIFTPVRWENKFLVDGGVVNPMPVDVVRDMGAEIVIGVDVLCMGQPRKPKKSVEKKSPTKLTPRFKSTNLAVVKKKINTLLQEHGHRIKILDELSRRVEPRIDSARGKIDTKAPSIFDVLMLLVHAMEYERMKLSLQAADIVISPDVSDIGAFAFHKGEEAIAEGYRAAKDALPRLRGIIGCS